MMDGDEFEYRSTQICPGPYDDLCIVMDYNDDPKDPHPVMLFTPDMNDTDEHYHIELTREQATVLRNWLDKYLNDKPVVISASIVEPLTAEDSHSSAAVYNAATVEICVAQDR